MTRVVELTTFDSRTPRYLFSEFWQGMAISSKVVYDEFGNLSVQARIEEEGAVGSPGSELPFLNISGRAVIDTVNQRLVFTGVEANAPLDDAPPAEVDLDRVRYYEFVDDLLTLSVRNSDGSVSATLTWRKIGG